MAESLLPPDICPQSETIELVDDGTSLFQPSLGRAAIQTQQHYEPRLRVVQTFRALRGNDRARMIAMLRRIGGKHGTLRAQIGRVQRGSFAATELFTYPTFANGTTGWTVTSGGALTVSDRIARMTVTQAAALQEFFATITTTQYAPHVVRAFLMDGAASVGKTIGPFIDGGYATGYSTSRGMIALGSTPNTSSGTCGIGGWSSDVIAGGYFEVPYLSASRCMQVDNGPCLITQSNAFGNAAWTASELTVTSDNIASPDGASTADRLAETTNNTTHQIGRTATTTISASALDYTFSVAVKSYGGRTHCWIQMVEGTGSTAVFQVFNLSTGALGATSSTGANWSNLRSKIRALGNDWYYVTITARKTNAATALNFYVAPSAGDHASTYVGSTTAGIYVYCATPSQSSHPTRLISTTASAVATGTAQTGNALYVKGLTVSTSDLLMRDDVSESNGELIQLTANLNSDAAGLGYIEFAPSLFRSPSDGDPIIVNTPMPKLKIVENPKWSNQWGVQADLELTFEQFYE